MKRPFGLPLESPIWRDWPLLIKKVRARDCLIVILFTQSFGIAATHWLTLSIWLALSLAMVEYMQWWPKPEQGLLGYLGPIPAFGAMAVPFIALFDW
jgi:hypothetical protein